MYYVSFNCHVCDNVVFYGPVASLLGEHQGLPVVHGDVLEQIYVECDHCYTAHHFGELDVYVEEGRLRTPAPDEDVR